MNRRTLKSIKDHEANGPAAKRQKTSAADDGRLTNQTIDIFKLNGDCFVCILKNLSCQDLFRLSHADQQLKKVVLEYGIPTKLIDFNELVDLPTLNVFKDFGKEMTKIEITQESLNSDEQDMSEFDEMLQLISDYCAMDKLKYLNIEYGCGTSLSKGRIYATLPYLRNLETFVITGQKDFGRGMPDTLETFPMVNDFINCIVANAVNIKSIEIRNIEFTGTFFYMRHVRNLESLLLNNCRIANTDGFISYMKSKPNLKSFSWLRSHMPGTESQLYELIADNMCDLDELQYHPWANAQQLKNFDVQLIKFKQLKKLSIDVVNGRILDTLVRTNSVRALIVNGCSHDERFLKQLNICNYKQLKSIKVKLSNPIDRKAYLEWIPQMPCLTKILLNVKGDFDFLFSIELYRSLMAQFHLNESRKPLTIYIRTQSVERLLFLLGQNYKSDLIRIRSYCFA